ncbi:solute carrier organic anion transporter family member 4A1-like [Diadema setosum]|uniref:solute carrier organic anion transporter family member 4A1-like n=1 Tax=Diadema setosum TaxID=31175 RepID=UPI003B3B2E69
MSGNINGITNPAFDDSEAAKEAPNKSRPVGVVHPSQVNNSTPTADKKIAIEKADSVAEEDITCGWGPFRPRCLQCCNNAVGFLVFVSIFGFIQGMTVNGLVYVVTTTLERRFNIPSVQSGFISSCYDFGVLIVVVFVTYVGEKAHKPVWLGVGALFFSLGSIIFTVPHFATDNYQFSTIDEPTCSLNASDVGGSSDLDSGLNRYLIVFIVGQLIHGISASGLYTLGYAYIDENTPPSRASIFVGIFQASSLFGPACGYLLGGVILEIYTDVDVDVATLGIDSESPLWIGAWWIGFLITASIAFLVSFPLMAFPRELPGRKKHDAARVTEAQKGAVFQGKSGFKNRARDFPRAVWCLVKNPPFMFLSLTSITEWFLLTSFATFGPKYLETQFSMTASDAALLAGYIIIPAGLVGTVVGGVVVSKAKLHFRGMINLSLLCLFISACTIPSFLISCDNPKMAGVTVPYGNSSLVFNGDEPMLDSACNANCSCGSAFDPVCGNDGILYYTPCHAGCLTINTTASLMTYADCACIEPESIGDVSSAVMGKCSHSCDFQIVFIVAFFVLLMLTLMATVPVTMATMRIVSHEQRSFALGFQSVLFRAFGTVPSPVVFGTLIDRTCILWERDDSGGSQCWQYDNAAFSRTSLILALSLRCGSLVFLTLCACFYKPVITEDQRNGGGNKVDEVENGEKADDKVTDQNSLYVNQTGDDTKL